MENVAARQSPGAGQARHLLVLEGPNLNQVGTRRDPRLYGDIAFAEFQKHLRDYADERGVLVTHVQSNLEGALINALQKAAANGTSAAIVNPGGLTHYSVSLADAVRDAPFPVIEVHLSNIHQRADRAQSVTGAAADAVFTGLGYLTYFAALDALLAMLSTQSNGTAGVEDTQDAASKRTPQLITRDAIRACIGSNFLRIG